MSLKDDYVASMVSQFKRWDAEFGMLSEKSAQASGVMKDGLDEQCRELRASRDAVYRSLQEIRKASESSWRAMQSRVDSAWTAIRIGLDEAAGRLNNLNNRS